MNRESGERQPARSGLFWTITGLGLFFAALHVVLQLTWFGHKIGSHELHVFIDVRNDFGPNTWLSVAAMVLAGVFALRLIRVRPDTERRGWLLVGGLFFYLGIDDAFLLHERINDWARQFVGDAYTFPWIKVVLPLFLVAGLLAFAFLWKTLTPMPARRREMFLGFACLGTAVGFEILERLLNDSPMTIRGFAVVQYPVVPEEFLEVLGPAFFVLCFGRVREAAALRE